VINPDKPVSVHVYPFPEGVSADMFAVKVAASTPYKYRFTTR